MKLTTANRAFLVLLAVSVAVYAALGVAALTLVAIVAYQAVTGAGLPGWPAGHDVRPLAGFLVPVGLGTATGWWSLRRQLRATRGLSGRVAELRVPAPPELVLAAHRTRTSRRRVDVVAAGEPFSFAYGLFVPRVVVSTGLVDAVSPAELDAVLEHERYHVRNLDPLKVLLARVLPSALFFLPALRDLERRYVTGRELAADRRALDAHGRVALAGALLKVVRGPGWSEMSAAAAIGGDELLDVRVAQLETGSEPAVAGVSRLLTALSVASVAILVWTFAMAAGDFGSATDAVVRAFPPAGLHVRSPFPVLGGAVTVAFWTWVVFLTIRGMRARFGRA